jgi:hypothetical protein
MHTHIHTHSYTHTHKHTYTHTHKHTFIHIRTHMSVRTTLIIEVDVGALLVAVRGLLGLLVPLEPRHVLLVEPPRVVLQALGRQELLVAALLEVEGQEERVQGQLVEERRVVREGQRLAGERRVRGERVLWHIADQWIIA